MFDFCDLDHTVFWQWICSTHKRSVRDFDGAAALNFYRGRLQHGPAIEQHMHHARRVYVVRLGVDLLHVWNG